MTRNTGESYRIGAKLGKTKLKNQITGEFMAVPNNDRPLKNMRRGDLTTPSPEYIHNVEMQHLIESKQESKGRSVKELLQDGYIRNEILYFAMEMENALRNSDPDKVCEWKKCDLMQLAGNLIQDYIQTLNSTHGKDLDDRKATSVTLANTAMMIWWRAFTGIDSEEEIRCAFLKEEGGFQP